MPHYPPPEVYPGKVGIWLVKLSSTPPTGSCLSSNPQCYPTIKPGGEKGIWLYDSLRTLLVEVYGYIKPPAPGEKILIKSPQNPKVTLERGVVGHTIDRCINLNCAHPHDLCTVLSFTMFVLITWQLYDSGFNSWCSNSEACGFQS